MIVEFNENLARTYNAKAFVLAFPREGPAEYNVGWGNGIQRIEGRHFILVKLDENGRPNGTPYGCGYDAFLTTYLAEDRQDVYRKSVQIRAHRAPTNGTLITQKGDETAIQPICVGQWLVKNPGGEIYAIPSDAEFEASYIEDVTCNVTRNVQT